ncbi:MAG: type II toxin-antitoxin system HipA family toxin [Gammaproteobacteria bacterium]|nr:type II toxin-antitoxin system HipA family toxin [Gammaproteobacteria bacterium]
MSDITVLDVKLHSRLIGTLTRLPGDRVLFAFTEEYAADNQRATLSLSFRDVMGNLILDSTRAQTRLPSFFANLLPEGALREYLASRAGVKPEREFLLIAELGRDLPGALEIVPSAVSARPDRDDEGTRAQTVPGKPDTVLHFSLAGVQLKFSAARDAAGGLTIPAHGVGGSWIVKLPSSRFIGLPENEFAMMSLARAVGVATPELALVPLRRISGLPQEVVSMGDHAYAIRRFDRTTAGGRIHIEDFAQVFGVYPEQKYQRASYRNIAEVIWSEAGEAAIAEFVRRLVFSMLIGNSDMHLKNWSLIYPDGRHAALAPAYDFVSTISYLPDDRLALTFVDSKEYRSITREQFDRFATKARLPSKLTLDTVAETVSRFDRAWRNSGPTAVDSRTRAAIERHLDALPLWRELRSRQG